MAGAGVVLVPPDRLARWLVNFEGGHGASRLDVVDGALTGLAEDGSSFAARLPFDRTYPGPPDLAAFRADAEPPRRWGLLLVRKGGFAVARLDGHRMVEHKVGQRHVQGRTKAGGQSQQRFARRREQQARVAYEAAAEHAARILAAGVELVVTGGDKQALDSVLTDRRLARLPRDPHVLDCGDPRRAVLDQAVADACSVRMSVTNA